MTYSEKPATPEELLHYGVKGMKWGVRKDSRLRPSNWMAPNKIDRIGWDRMIAAERKLGRHTNYGPAYQKDLANYKKVKAEVDAERAAARGPSRKTNKAALKDAREFARAKMFYGEGAGTRRKLIKARVEAMSKKDPQYKKAFEKHLSDQDMAVHAAKARRERKRKNVANSTAKTTRGISHYLRGNPQYASAAAAMIAGGALWAHKNGVDKTILKAGKTALKSLKKSNIKPGMTASDFLKNL